MDGSERACPRFLHRWRSDEPDRIGQTIKIGRRGSITARITVEGTQGHVAYPSRVDNPIHRLTRALAELTTTPLDEGNEWFEPSSLQVTTMDVGNPTTNLVPASASAVLNIRFNNAHTGASLEKWLKGILARHADRVTVDVSVDGESFLTTPNDATVELAEAVRSVAGLTPELDTGGGTSDARFISRYCDVAEFGLVSATIHQANENVAVGDLRLLTEIYGAFLTSYFSNGR